METRVVLRGERGVEALFWGVLGTGEHRASGFKGKCLLASPSEEKEGGRGGGESHVREGSEPGHGSVVSRREWRAFNF